MEYHLVQERRLELDSGVHWPILWDEELQWEYLFPNLERLVHSLLVAPTVKPLALG